MPPETKNGQHCEAHAVKIEHLEDSDTRQWHVLDRVQNRLPIWATFLFAGLSSAVVGLAVKLSTL